MKKLIIASMLSLFAVSSMAAGEVKKVCKDKVDAKGAVVKGKDGKPVQECIEIYRKTNDIVHEKLISDVQNIDNAISMNITEDCQ